MLVTVNLKYESLNSLTLHIYFAFYTRWIFGSIALTAASPSLSLRILGALQGLQCYHFAFLPVRLPSPCDSCVCVCVCVCVRAPAYQWNSRDQVTLPISISHKTSEILAFASTYFAFISTSTDRMLIWRIRRWTVEDTGLTLSKCCCLSFLHLWTDKIMTYGGWVIVRTL